jgi:phage-related protein
VKKLLFLGTAYSDPKAFPEDARRKAGQQLNRVQHGLMPVDWKAMPLVGPGVLEIRVWGSAGTYRVLYVGSIGDEVFVLHCFQKKSAHTSRRDISLASARYKAYLNGAKP